MQFVGAGGPVWVWVWAGVGCRCGCRYKVPVPSCGQSPAGLRGAQCDYLSDKPAQSESESGLVHSSPSGACACACAWLLPSLPFPPSINNPPSPSSTAPPPLPIPSLARHPSHPPITVAPRAIRRPSSTALSQTPSTCTYILHPSRKQLTRLALPSLPPFPRSKRSEAKRSAADLSNPEQSRANLRRTPAHS